MKQGLGLGKGIGALIPKELLRPELTAQQALVDTNEVVTGVAEIDIERVSTNPVQPRLHFDEGALRELAQSIVVHGVITPITVRPHFDGFELISGERRLRASKMAGRTTIPAYVIHVGSDAQMLEISLVENLQREDLNPLEVAQGYQRLIEECNLKQEDVAIKVGKDRSTVSNFLRLMKLPSDAQSALRTRRISMGHARALLALSSDSMQLVVLREIIKKELSVRKTEALVKDVELGRKELVKGGEIKSTTFRSATPRIGPKNGVADSLGDIENSLRHLFGTQVRVRMKNDESGSVDIEFYSLEELERIIEMMLSMNNAGESR